jgi:hypothetical protein
MELKFAFEKETKNTYRFEELSTSPVVGYLYIKKAAFTNKQPNKITVTIKVDE